MSTGLSGPRFTPRASDERAVRHFADRVDERIPARQRLDRFTGQRFGLALDRSRPRQRATDHDDSSDVGKVIASGRGTMVRPFDVAGQFAERAQLRDDPLLRDDQHAAQSVRQRLTVQRDMQPLQISRLHRRIDDRGPDVPSLA